MYMKNIRQFKSGLRAEAKRSRENIIPASKARMDGKIKKRLFDSAEYKNAEIIITYVSKNNEVDTKNIICESLKNDKRIAVPRCNSKNISMDFYEISSLGQLEQGAYGILEPVPSLCRKIRQYSNTCICLVPGLSFDSYGYRLGYGKGYYDRFLAGFSGGTIGLCYCANVCRELPHGYFDKPIDTLITEKYLRRIKDIR